MIGLFFLNALVKQDIEPALWIRQDGNITVDGRAHNPTFSPGVKKLPVRNGWGYDFEGRRSGILLPDLPQLALTGSMTVSVWLRPRGYVSDGPGAQILFRGDDRCGHDPYTLVIHHNGTVNFGVQDANDRGMQVSAEIPLHKWTHVTATFEDSPVFDRRTLRMWIDGELKAFSTTSRAPFSILDKGQAPGVGIGNVQNEKGPHNQPFNGSLFDLRLYRGTVEPGDAGFRPGGIISPSQQ